MTRRLARSGHLRTIPEFSWAVLSPVFLALGLAVLGACNKPNEGDVRRCKGGSNRDTVQCALRAKTKDDLRTCGFFGSAEPATK